MFAFCMCSLYSQAQQPMETEEANLLQAKLLEVSATYEFQTSVNGTENALPFAIAYGISDRLEIAVEPVPYTSIKSKSTSSVKGVGDIEATLTYNFFKENKRFPALALAYEVKFPTARNTFIGTGKADHTFYLIATKNIKRFENHINVGYAIIGQPAGVTLQNVFAFALATEFHVNNKLDLIGEILANTSAVPQETNSLIENSTSPELSGGEIVGMIGGRYYFNNHFFAAFGVTYDNNNAFLFRPGLTYIFGHVRSRSKL